jgi:hypothetical protein
MVSAQDAPTCTATLDMAFADPQASLEAIQARSQGQ